MAKGDVTLKFDAQTAAFVQDVIKARRAMDDASDSSRKLGEGMKTAGENAEKSGGMMDGLAGKLAGLGSAATLAKIGISTLTEFLDKADARAAVLLDSIQKITNAAASAGQSQFGSQVRAGLDKIVKEAGGVPASPKEVDDSYLAISNSVGDKVGVDAKINAVRLATYVRGSTGASPDQANKAGINRALLAQYPNLGEQAFNLPAWMTGQHRRDQIKGRLDSLAYEASIHLADKGGTFDNRELEIISESKDKQQAIDLIFAAHSANLRSRGLAPVLQSADQQKLNAQEVRKLQKEANHGSVEARRKLRIDAIAPEHRVESIISDESLVEDKNQAYVRTLRGAARALHGKGRMSVVQSAIDYRDSLDSQGKLYEQDRAAAALLEQEKLRDAERDLRINTAQKGYELQMRKEHPTLSRYVPDQFIHTEAGIVAWKRDNPGGEAPANGEEHLNVLQEISDKLSNIGSIQRTRRDTALRNDNPYQQ